VNALRAEVRPHPVTGSNHSYLLASYNISDPVAAMKVEKKLFRNRSAEVGTYVDNDEAEYGPALMGFAYVDIPAIEGLNFGKRADVRRFAMEKEGDPMGAPVDSDEVIEPEDEVVEPEAEDEVVESEDATSEDEVETIVPEVDEEVDEEVEPAAVDEVITSDGRDAGSGFSATPNISTFGIDINGVRVTDPKVIQEYVNNLNGVVAESRATYSKGLFASDRITSGQKDSMDEFTKGLTTEQWSQFRTIFDDSPAIPTLAFRQVVENSEDVTRVEAERQLHSEVIQHLRRGIGDKVKETEIYRQFGEENKEGK
jgi:hypothetical protein